MELDEVARQLYAAPPEEFVATRDEHVRQARAAGDRTLAARLAKLRRPTQSAWLVNLLWLQRRELVEELLGLSEQFRGEELTRQRLQELTTRRRELLHRLQMEAQRLSADAGVLLTADRAREVEATMAAALADPEAAEQVRGGRLVTALSYSGLGPVLQLVAAPAAEADSAADAAAPPVKQPAERAELSRMGNLPTRSGTMSHPRQKDAAAEAKAAADAAKARATAERLVRQRTEAWKDAVRHRDILVRRRDSLRTELDRIQQRLERVEAELTEAEQDVLATSNSLEQARAAAQDGS